MKSANMKLLTMAGKRKDPECYRIWLDSLSRCIFEDKHENCAHHDGHNYRTASNRRVACPWHREELQKYLNKLKSNAYLMIDKRFGKVETNPLESGYQHVWGAGIKGTCLGANHVKMCVTQGYLNSNQTAMREVMGPEYSWRLTVYKRAGCACLWGQL